MREEGRARIIREKVARMTIEPRPAIVTGISELDTAIGGLPRGAIVEIAGGPGSGKTTLALRCVAQFQRNGGEAAWIDAEHSFDAAYAGRLGIAVERLPLAHPQSAEQALEIARRLALSGAVDLLVIDSAAALAPEVELQAGIGNAGPGAHSRALASGLRRLAGALRRSGTTALFLNQTRVRGHQEIAAGGPPLKLFAALRVLLRPAPEGRVRFQTLKNKASRITREGEWTWDGASKPSKCP
jgi:recombination protein RecA